MSYIFHVVSHSHWDREWYLPFEQLRLRLVALLDNVLDTLAAESRFHSFHLDGQIVALEDYLELRPHRTAEVIALVQSGRLAIGPWYTLQDEFLTGGEAQVRNLLLGIQKAERFGGAVKIGYFPDSFGNSGQAPQLLRGFGIDNAVFGRGLPTHPQQQSASEIFWTAPDGSQVLGIFFAGWYCNGIELPVDESTARERAKRIADKLVQFAGTRHLLVMNGCDHQPLQTDLPDAITAFQKARPDDTVQQTSLLDYITAVRAEQADFPVIQGELRGQATDGWLTLANTASARIYLKQLNEQAQRTLEREAEPFAAFAALHGAAYPQQEFRYAWELLLQNHAHDSICGCSTDQVHRENIVRFDKSLQISTALRDKSLTALAALVDTMPGGEDAIPIVVFNAFPWIRSECVSVTVDLARTPGAPAARTTSQVRALEDIPLGSLSLVDAGGALPCTITDLGVVWDYNLPDDRFRQPFWARRVQVDFFADTVSACGYDTFFLVRGTEPQTDLSAGEDWMQNQHLRVEVNRTGALRLVELASNTAWDWLNVYEWCGDDGDEYIFRQRDASATTYNLPVSINTVELTPAYARMQIEQTIAVNASATDDTPVAMVIHTSLTLKHDSRIVEIVVTWNNIARDYRLRALFPTGLNSGTHLADAPFEIVRRSNAVFETWQNPSNPQIMQSFVAVEDTSKGLMIISRGLPEYEIIRDGANTIGLTLLRAVGRLGDWGVFPTEDSQCTGQQRVEYAIQPYSGTAVASGACRYAANYSTPMIARQTGLHPGKLGISHSFIPAQAAPGVFCSTVKRAENSSGTIVRLWNGSKSEQHATLRVPDVQIVHLDESPDPESQNRVQTSESNNWRIVLPPHRIVTVKLPNPENSPG